MPGFIFTLLLLLAFGITEASLGPRGDRLTSFLALVCIAPIFLHLVRGSAPRTARGAGLLAAAVAGIAVWYADAGAARYFALAAALGSLALVQPKTSDRARLAQALALTAFGLAAFVAIRDYLTLWPALVTISVRLSSTIASWLGDAYRLGPSYSGAWLLVAFGIAFAGRSQAARRFEARIGIPAILLLFLVTGAALALRSLAPAHFHGFDARVALGWRLLQFVLLLLPMALFMSAHPLRGDAPAGRSGPKALTGAAAAVMLVGLVLLSWSTRVEPSLGRVLLDARGSFSMEPLEWGSYGSQAPSGASLATLPTVLRSRGFEFATCDTFLDAAQLEGSDVLVIMNPTAEYTAEEHEAIWDFVRAGGGLLVLGDHTNILGTLGPLNALLEPTGVRVEFDSAIPLVERWTWYGCMRVHPHPVTRGVRDETDVKISVGASLSVPASAVPLFTGRQAYSDAGDWNNEKGAYLGNMSYDRFETLGDLFLAAEVPYGRGKVIVFGDTSAFQRVAVFNTHELITRVTSYLCGAGSAVAPFPVRMVGAGLFLLGGVLLAPALPAAVAALAGVASLATVWLLGVEHVAVARLPQEPLRGDVAWVDLAHGNRVDTHSGVDHGIHGLNNHLWRHGFVPLAMKEFDTEALATARVFVTVTPSFPFAKSEVQALRRFVENGGLLIVASGYEEVRGARSLLAEFGYDIGRTPIGAAHQSRTSFENQFVLMHESWPVLHPEGRGEVWVECWGYPLVVFERIGEGGLLVIGDSGFLWDSSLETNDSFVEQNIDFLRAAIETAQSRMGRASP